MEGALLIGLEIAAFFAVIYLIELKRYQSFKDFEVNGRHSKEGIMVTQDNVDKIPTVFAIELKKMLNNSKDGAVLLGNTELLEVLRNYQQAARDGLLDGSRSGDAKIIDRRAEEGKSLDGKPKGNAT